MMKKKLRQILKKVVLIGMSTTLVSSIFAYAAPEAPSEKKFTDQFSMTKLATYQAAAPNSDGGVAEIVTYNRDNQKFYLVNGAANPPSLDIVSLHTSAPLTKDQSINIKTLVETNGFVFGDLTSVEINTNIDRVFVSVQAAGVTDAGKIVELDYDGNLIAEYTAGIQPDMVVSTPDGKYVLTANEGEPRTAGVDPQGSITILDTTTTSVQHLYFDNPAIIDDHVHIRGASHPTTGVISTKGSKADALFDLEPEYITISADGARAFVALQENNAIATIDLSSKSIVSVKGLGLKDLNITGNELDLVRDNNIKLENVPFQGIYNPDGIANLKVGNKTYLFSANEGDATDWPGRKNASSVKTMKNSLTAGSVAATFLNGKTTYDGLEVSSGWGNDSIYLYGARSFSIWDAEQMTQVYDSGSDFERVIANRLPAHFNASHSSTTMDNRSTRKGPEPESIELGKIGDRTYAFVGLERIGGVMVYDVTNPEQPQFVNYTNTRVFTPVNNLNTETGPEGLEFIPGAVSPTGWPLLLIANEVSGNVSVMQINLNDDQIAPSKPGQPFVAQTSASSIRVAWSAAKDNVTLAGYRVYVDEKFIATVRTPSYELRGVTEGQTYSVVVEAIDQANNLSAASNMLNISTIAGASADTWKISDNNFHRTATALTSSQITNTSFQAQWSTPAGITDISRYELYVNGAYMGATSKNAHTFRALGANRQYTLRLVAVDEYNQRTVLPDLLQVTTANTMMAPDQQAPTSPTLLSASRVSSKSVRLSWSAATDNVAVHGYIITRNGKPIAYTSTRNVTIRNLKPNTNYTFAIQAYDRALNRSALSNPINVTTLTQ
jgi:chitodextrinase